MKVRMEPTLTPPFHNVFLALPPELLFEIMELWVGELNGKHISI